MIVDCFEDVFMAMFKSTQGSDAEKVITTPDDVTCKHLQLELTDWWLFLG